MAKRREKRERRSVVWEPDAAQWDPVHPGRLHGHGSNPAPAEPIGEGMHHPDPVVLQRLPASISPTSQE
jgi:hypothetical protein